MINNSLLDVEAGFYTGFFNLSISKTTQSQNDIETLVLKTDISFI